MAQSDVLKRYLDEGMKFTQMTQARAESIVNRLVRTGELQADEAQSAVQELVDRSRKNTERLLASIRKEVAGQVHGLGLATKADISRLEKRIDAIARAGRATAPKAAATKATKAAKPAKAVKATKATKAAKPAKAVKATKATAKKSAAKRPAG